uniref:Uncharacterized protein n=1 Tax=Chenopodium quinoa TaxID=63459 RepID=A0A803N3X9_CHEQI
MMNNGIGMMSASSSTSGGVSSINNNNTQSSLKNYFKTPEGRYKLQYEKSHPSSLISWKYRFPATARILGSSNGRALSFVRGNGGGKYASNSSRNGSIGASTLSYSNNSPNFDGKGTYLIFSVRDTIFISDLNSQDKVGFNVVLLCLLISSWLSNSNPLCRAFDPDAKDGHDLLIRLNSGDVSLRQQLQDMGKKLVGTHHHNKGAPVNERY